jgi:hypothetical protein
MHLTLNRPSLATGKVKWLSAPAGLLLIALPFGLLNNWLPLYVLISLMCFICSSLALGHMLVATGQRWFRVIMITVNLLGIGVALFIFFLAAVYII